MSYKDVQCPILQNPQVLEKKWMVRIMGELHSGPKRFNELKQDLPGITQAVLSSRLKELEASKLVQRKEVPGNFAAFEYCLNCGETDKLFTCWDTKNISTIR